MKAINVSIVNRGSLRRYYLGENYPSVYLTQREVDIIKQLTAGTYKDIAYRVGISRRTLESYIVEIRQKLSCQNKRHLIAFAIASGLLDQLV
ncbi:MAG: helix-turn-helix transcriptional regulator [Gammaproteobacteria bacterium]|nr:helix-turn-helix transcriptional regulator [Gammaproteobacteria bacterium]